MTFGEVGMLKEVSRWGNGGMKVLIGIRGMMIMVSVHVPHGF